MEGSFVCLFVCLLLAALERFLRLTLKSATKRPQIDSRILSLLLLLSTPPPTRRFWAAQFKKVFFC
jgi:hypothetical protein